MSSYYDMVGMNISNQPDQQHPHWHPHPQQQADPFISFTFHQTPRCGVNCLVYKFIRRINTHTNQTS